MGFSAIPAAGMLFFFSAWLTMVFWGIVAPKLGVPTISYTTAMLVTIALWLVLAPLAAAAARMGGGRRGGCW
jgi:hypothetical protein